MKILVSSCLLGINCKYNGKNNFNQKVVNLKNQYELIPICPEVLGGLLTPRVPAEILNDKVINQNGQDVTKEYLLGATKSLEIAKNNNCQVAILKSKSPSCGYGEIYDGSFSKKIVNKNGVTADLLFKNGIVVLNENNFVEKL